MGKSGKKKCNKKVGYQLRAFGVQNNFPLHSRVKEEFRCGGERQRGISFYCTVMANPGGSFTSVIEDDTSENK